MKLLSPVAALLTLSLAPLALAAGPKDAEIRAALARLTQTDAKVRFDAAKKLGFLGMKGEGALEVKAINALHRALADNDRKVAIAARLSLGEVLREHFSELRKASREGKVDRAAAMTKGLLPDLSRARLAFREAMPEPVKERLDEFYKKLTPSKKESLAKLLGLRESDTEVRVYSATTEELKEPPRGSMADKQFPGGARRLAVQALRPNVLFFEIQCVSPGESRGIRYHLFFWDGERWTMLGPVWRALR